MCSLVDYHKTDGVQSMKQWTLQSAWNSDIELAEALAEANKKKVSKKEEIKK